MRRAPQRCSMLLVLLLVLAFVPHAARAAEQPFGPVPANDAEREAVHLRNIRRLTFAGTKNGEAYFAPDGKRIVFQGVREPELNNPFYQIYTLDLATGLARRVSPGTGRTTCSFFHPTQPRLLFASSHLDRDAERLQREETERLQSGPARRYQWDFDPKLDLFETGLDGKNALRLTDAEGYDAECAYSPDGTKIVFCSFRDGDGEIYVMDPDGRNAKRLTSAKGYDGGPFFAPDGKQIVWRRFSADNKTAEIWLMDADGAHQRQVTRLNSIAWAPYFHPSDEWLAFACNHEDPGFELYALKLDGKELTRLTYSDGFDGLPVFSPDGRQLLWTSNRGRDGSHLFLADVALPGVVPALPPEQKVERGSIDLDRLRAHLDFFTDIAVTVRVENGDSEPIEAYLAQGLRDAGLLPLRAEEDGRAVQVVDYIVPAQKTGHGNSHRVAGALLPQGQTWAMASAAASGVRFLVLYADLFRRVGKPEITPLLDSQEHLALWLEVLRELSGVARFRGLKLGVLFVASDGLGEGSLKGLLEGLVPAERVAAVIGVSRLGAPGREAALEGLNAGEGWRRLAEQLAAANPRLSLGVSDERNGLVEVWKDRLLKDAATFEISLKPLLETDGIPALLVTDPAWGQSRPLAQPNYFERFAVVALRDRATLALGAVYRLATSDVEAKSSAFDRALTIAQRRPYLGTKPEYQGDGTGVVLQGVNPGSPAEAAGLKTGDKVVRLGALVVKDAEGYLKALEALKPGAEAEIFVLREGKELRLTVKVGSR